MRTTGVLVYPGFDELDAVGPYEVLVKATLGPADWRVVLVGEIPSTAVSGGHGLQVVPVDTPGTGLDLLIVPGGGWVGESEDRGVKSEIRRGALPKLIADLHGSGTSIAGVCTGAMLLSAAGLLRQRPATTHRVAFEALASEGANVVDARVVDDGDVLTCGGVTAGLDLALWLVERECGEKLANLIAVGMEYERQGSVHRGPRSKLAVE